MTERKDARESWENVPIEDTAPFRLTDVIEALARVMRELPAIGKESKGDHLPYKYRSIEDMTGVIHPLLGKYGVVFVPHVTECEIKEVNVGGKAWTDTILTVTYDVYGPSYPDGEKDKITVGPLIAIGRDNSDKGANKALTQAFKYALLQVLCISDSRDDGDNQVAEADAVAPTEAQVAMRELTTLINGFFPEEKKQIQEYLRERFGPSAQMNLVQIEDAKRAVIDKEWVD